MTPVESLFERHEAYVEGQCYAQFQWAWRPLGATVPRFAHVIGSLRSSLREGPLTFDS